MICVIFPGKFNSDWKITKIIFKVFKGYRGSTEDLKIQPSHDCWNFQQKHTSVENGEILDIHPNHNDEPSHVSSPINYGP